MSAENRYHESLREKLIRLYGEQVYRETRLYTKLRVKKGRCLATLAFLRRCRDTDIIPTFIRISHHISTRRANNIIARAEKELLRERVRATYQQLDQLQEQILQLDLRLRLTLAEGDWRTIHALAESSERAQHRLYTERQRRKYHALVEAQIRPGRQSATERQPRNTVVNMSSRNFSPEVMSVLEKGFNYALAPKRIPTEEIISEVEAGIRLLPGDVAEDIRRESARVLRTAKPPKSNISREEKAALQEVRRMEDIVVTRADKGNATVILDRLQYTNKVDELLEETTYSRLRRDPTTTIERETREIIRSSSIPPEQQRFLLPSASKPPRLYGLPKIHKPGVPFRPIVSSIGSPTYAIARFLANGLRPFYGNSPSFVKNAQHFREKLAGLRIEEDDLLASFDVVSLFTNIPINEVGNVIAERLLPKGLSVDYPRLTHFVISKTYFKWNDTFFEQTSGSPMGSPLSPAVASIFMEHLEEKILNSSQLKPKCWLRYVDDVFVVWPHGRQTLDEFLEHANRQHRNIQFTMELEENNTLPFLDVLVEKRNGDIQFKVYRKPTHTDRYLHATSHHHPKQKRGLMNTLVHRAKTICSENHLQSELDHLRGALIDNGYRPREIERALHRNPTPRQEREQAVARVCIPYVQGLTDRLARVLKRRNVEVTFRTGTKIGQLMPPNKDPIPQLSTQGVYQIPCVCGKSYIGQTGRSIDCRLKEHKRDVRAGRIERSAVAEHVCNIDHHEMRWDDTRILSKDSKYHQRVIREALEIMRTPNNINREDGYQLSRTWRQAWEIT